MERWIVIVLVAGACGKGGDDQGRSHGLRSMDDYDRAKIDKTKVDVARLAFDVYPKWQSVHESSRCPGSLAELAKFVDLPDTKDIWGNDFVMKCGADAPPEAQGGIGVASAGPDGKMGTDDDIQSWHPNRD